MNAIDLIVPGELNTPTGGYIYDREILAGLDALGWRTAVHALDPSFPRPTPAALRAARAAFASIPAGRLVVIDGLALPGLDRILADEARRLNLVALVHHPVALETGIDPATARHFEDAERRALAHVRRVITTSQWTARALASYDVPVAALRVVEPGVDRRQTHGSTDPQTTGVAPAEHDTLNLLCVATLTPRKDHRTLLRALARLRDLRWTSLCVGSTTRDPACAAGVRADIRGLGLGRRIRLAGETDTAGLARHYRAASVFALASRHEGYGMAFAEALVHGLPVAAVRAGAVPLVVPSRAGLLVRPADPAALAGALRRLLGPAGRRYARNASALRFPDWRTQAVRLWAAVEELVP